jgi:hypothetical protein
MFLTKRNKRLSKGWRGGRFKGTRHAKFISPTIAIALACGLSLSGYFFAVQPPSAYADSCVVPTYDYGTDTLNLSVSEAANYTVWVRMQIPSTDTNSVMLQVDSNTCYTVTADGSTPLNTWTWVNYYGGNTSQIMSQALSAGSHSLEFIGINTGVEVDNVLLISDPTCVPTGNGTNCTSSQSNPPPSAGIISPAASSEVYGSSATIDSTATPNNSGSIVSSVLSISGTPLQTIDNSPFNFSFNALGYADGSYTLSVDVTDNENNSATASVSVYVANGDLNNQGAVNVSDLAIMASHWQQTDSAYADGNITGQATINISDLAVLAANWGWSE